MALRLLAERDELTRRVEAMHHIIRQFQRAQFGRRSDKLDTDQLHLALEEREIATAREQATAEKQATTPRPRSEPGQRKSLPSHLPRSCWPRGSRSTARCWRSGWAAPVLGPAEGRTRGPRPN